MSQEIDEVWKEFGKELDAHKQMADNLQSMFEESIANAAALKLISDNSIEKMVGN
jgi:hypothetical protein